MARRSLSARADSQLGHHLLGKAARDPAGDYPYRQRELAQELTERLGRRVTPSDIQAVSAAHNVKRRAEWFFQSQANGSPGLYSEEVRQLVRGLCSARRAVSPALAQETLGDGAGQKAGRAVELTG